MKIVQIVSSSRLSGAEKHVVLLCSRLQHRSHAVQVFCPQGGWVPQQLRSSGVPVAERKLRGAGVLRAAAAVYRCVRHSKADLIHSHLTKATYIGCLVSRLANVPLISSLHTRTTDLVYRRLLPFRNNRIITVSNFLRTMLMRQGIPPAILTTVYNGTEFFEPEHGQSSAADGAIGESGLPLRAELNLPSDAELIGLFGHVGERKGHPLLVRAARSIVARRPRAYFVFVGQSEPQMQRCLWEMAVEDGVADRLRYVGLRSDVAGLMDQMDVVTVPSAIESFGMVIIEAMARSRPVVATRVGGIPEVITHGETGILVERDPDELADAIAGLLENPARREHLATCGRENARQKFSLNTMVDNIEAVYRTVREAVAAGEARQ